MKITIRAVLVNLSEDKRNIIDSMLKNFCSAVRYSFKRLLEGKKIDDLEKEIYHKYGFNIRQAKDAVESARQTIVSQRELLKLNKTNLEKKVRAIEAILEKKDLTAKKRNGLESKLAKRQRVLQYCVNFINKDKIPPVVFGTKVMFLKRCKGIITHDEWVSLRNNRIYSRGDKTKNGNPNLRVVIKDGMSFLEISTLEKTETNRAIKIQVLLQLLKDKLVKNLETFNSKNEWSKWSFINERLLKIERQVKKPGFWIENRKTLLGML